MPNWAEGNIRFRGNKENIMEFLKNEIECTATNKEFEVVTYRPVIEWTKFDEINFSEPEEAKKENNFWKSLYDMPNSSGYYAKCPECGQEDVKGDKAWEKEG